MGLGSHLKIGLLTIIVILAFLFSTLLWQHIDTSEKQRILVAAIILIGLYSLIVFELIDRNLAALIGAAVSVAAYDCLVERASMKQILQWEDLETLALLFGMMIIVNVLACSGLFDFVAIWSYKKSGGHFWSLVSIMALTTGILSAFIDNVSTMLLISPTLIKLSELEHIDPRFLLMIMAIASNLGGSATPVGDPPNLIIISDQLSEQLGITFGSFTAYCMPCVIISMAAFLLYLRLIYKSKESFRLDTSQALKSANGETLQVEEEEKTLEQVEKNLTKELEILQLMQTEIHTHSKSDRLRRLQKELDGEVQAIEFRLERIQREQQKNSNKAEFVGLTVYPEEKLRRGSRLASFEIDNLIRSHSIKNWPVLLQSLVVLLVTILLFFIHSIPGTNLTLGWISLFAGLTMLVLSSTTTMITSSESSKEVSKTDEQNKEAGKQKKEHSNENFEHVINQLEWSTLLFFFSLFIVMEVMAKLGLISFMGKQVTLLIDQIPHGLWRSIGSITIILWSSGIASALIDNVPFTTMMIKVLGTMVLEQQVVANANYHDQSQSIMIKPLVFALAFGCCFGGNGTLIGASANLVTASVSGRNGFPISFNNFAKFSLPITIISLIIANIYLVVVFVLLEL